MNCYTGTVEKLGPSGEVVWATYSGGTNQPGETGQDSVNRIAIDSQGNVWVSGSAGTKNFPISQNAYQSSPTGEFLAELSPNGSKLLYSTFITGQLMAIGPDDAIYLAGATATGNVALKFEPATNDVAYTVSTGFTAVSAAIGETGTFYLSGFGYAANVPITPGVYSHPSSTLDIAMICIDPSGGLIFSTVIGGSGNNILTAMARDDAGNLYLAGIQQPTAQLGGLAQRYPVPFLDFPTTSDALYRAWSPAFLVKLSPDASTLLYSTYIGKPNLEIASVMSLQPEGLQVGSDGTLRMIAVSDQNDFALTPNSYEPCFPNTFLGHAERWTSRRILPRPPGDQLCDSHSERSGRLWSILF